MLALAFALLTSASVPNAAAQAQLDRGKAAIEELEYGVAAEEFMAVATNKSASDAQKLEANLLAGVVQRILGSNVEAKLHLMYVFARDPDAKLPPGQPPKVTGFFELVREEANALHQLRAAQTRGPPVATTATEAPPPAPPSDGVEPASPLSAPVPSPTTVVPAPANTDDDDDAKASATSVSLLLVGGLGGLGVGAGLALVGLVGGIASEVAFVTPTLSTDIRRTTQITSAASWGTLAIGVVVVGAGVAAASIGAFE